jgi:geranylgeranyl diphosphate synthase type I
LPPSDRSAEEILAPYRDPLEAALRQAVGDGSDPIEQAARYVMGWEDAHGRPADAGGKRLRPLLCLLAAESVGGTAQEAMSGAVAVELVHNFSLVHDDIQDRDSERHGRPTAWKLWGEAQAINLGDFLYARAFRAILAGMNPPAMQARVLRVLTQAVEAMIRGQWADLSFEDRDETLQADYMAMVEGKTSALLGSALEIGAIMGGAPEETAVRMAEWGRLIGKAFQVRDDILGIWGDPDHTGKANTSDISRRKKSLPIVLALAHPRASRAVAEAYAKREIEQLDVQRVLAALDAAEIMVKCESIASDIAQDANQALSATGLSAQSVANLRTVGDFLVNRDA